MKFVGISCYSIFQLFFFNYCRWVTLNVVVVVVGAKSLALALNDSRAERYLCGLVEKVVVSQKCLFMEFKRLVSLIH